MSQLTPQFIPTFRESSVTASGTDFLHGNQMSLFERREAPLQFTEPYFHQKLLMHQPVLKEPIRMSEHMTEIRSVEMMAYSKRKFAETRRLEKEFAQKIKETVTRQRREEEASKTTHKDKRARWWHRHREPDVRDPLKYARFTNLSVKPDDLVISRDIVILQLTGARLGDEAMTWVGAFLQQSSTVKRLILQGNYITAEGIRNIVLGVRASKSLMEIDLSLNPIGDEGVAMICNALQENSRMSRVYQLNFSTCDLTAQAGFYLARLIRDFKQLQSLLLWRNRIGVANGAPQSGFALIMEELRNAPHMRLVNLTANNIMDGEAADHATVLERAKLKSANIEYEKKMKAERITKLRAEITERRARAIWDDERVTINRLERQAEQERQGLDMLSKIESRSKTHAQRQEIEFADRVLKLTKETLVLSRRPLRLILAGNHSIKPHSISRLGNFYDVNSRPDFDAFLSTKRRFDNLVIPRRKLGEPYNGPRDIDSIDSHDPLPWDGQFDTDYFHERRTAILQWREDERIKEEEMVLGDFNKFKVTDVKKLPPGEREVASSGFAVTSTVNSRIRTVRDPAKALQQEAIKDLKEEERKADIRNGKCDDQWEVKQLTESEVMANKLKEREEQLRAHVEAKQKVVRERPAPMASPAAIAAAQEPAKPVSQEEKNANDQVSFLVPRMRELRDLRAQPNKNAELETRARVLDRAIFTQKKRFLDALHALPHQHHLCAPGMTQHFQAFASELVAAELNGVQDESLLLAVTQVISAPYAVDVLLKASQLKPPVLEVSLHIEETPEIPQLRPDSSSRKSSETQHSASVHATPASAHLSASGNQQVVYATPATGPLPVTVDSTPASSHLSASNNPPRAATPMAPEHQRPPSAAPADNDTADETPAHAARMATPHQEATHLAASPAPARAISAQKRTGDDIALESQFDELLACLSEIDAASSSSDRVASLQTWANQKKKAVTEKILSMDGPVRPSLPTMVKCTQTTQHLTASGTRTDCLLLKAIVSKIDMGFADEVIAASENLPPSDEELEVERKVNAIVAFQARIYELGQIGSPSDEDLTMAEATKKEMQGKKKELARYIEALSSMIVPTPENVAQFEDFVEDMIKETDIAFGNSDLLQAFIRRVQLPYSEMIAQRGLAVVAACDGSQAFLRTLLKVPNPQFDVTELACACFFNQTARIPLTLMLLEFVDIAPHETDLGQMTREFFEDIASEKKAIPKEDRKRRINLLRLLLNELPDYRFSMDTEGGDGQTFFTRALYEGDLELVKLIVEEPERIANVNAAKSDSTTPLIQAVLGNNPQVLKVFFETFGETVDVNQGSAHGNALDLAVNLGRDQKIVDMLKAKGAYRTGAAPPTPTAVMTPNKTTAVKVRVGPPPVFGLGSRPKPAAPAPLPPKKDSDDDDD